jgi:hypothetical protein
MRHVAFATCVSVKRISAPAPLTCNLLAGLAVPMPRWPAEVIRIRSVVFPWKIVSRTELIIPFVPSVTKLVIVAPSDERASCRCPFVPVVPDFMDAVLLNVVNAPVLGVVAPSVPFIAAPVRVLFVSVWVLVAVVMLLGVMIEESVAIS